MGQGRLRRLFTRRRLKWVGTVLCVLVLSIGVASAWYEVQCWFYSKPNQLVNIGISRGRLVFGVHDLRVRVLHLVLPLRHSGGRASLYHRPLDNPSLNLRPQWPTPYTTGSPASTMSYAYLPLWIPLLLLSAPDARLWWTDRRAKPWQCAECRYDLRGLDGGVCPECGAKNADGNNH